MNIDWDEWYSCPGCPALKGGACYLLSSGGPEAIPPIFSEVPHSTRVRVGSRPSTSNTAPSTSNQLKKVQPGTPRKAIDRTQSLADQWRKKAAQQAEKRNR